MRAVIGSTRFIGMKWIRIIAYTIIGLFLAGFFVPFVGMALYDGFRRNPRALIEFAQLPGCWLTVAGPLLFWVSLAAFYFRLPKETRRVSLGTLGINDVRPSVARRLFSEYRRRHGYDWLLWLVTLSGIVTLAIVVILVAGSVESRMGH